MRGSKKIKGGGGGGRAEPPSTRSSGSKGPRPGPGDRTGTSEVGGVQPSGRGGGDHVGGGSPNRNVSGHRDQQTGGGVHPLLDQVILGNLFKFLPLDSLATSRLVCRTWHDLTLSTWRSKATLKIIFFKPDNEYYLKDREEWTVIGQFLEFWEANCRIKPYRQFHLVRWRFGERKVGGGPDVTRFWEVVGPQMTKLTMDGCKSTNAELFLQVINNSCPNLETLILHESTFSSYQLWLKKGEENPNHVYKAPAHGEHLNLKSLQISRVPHTLMRGLRASNLIRITNMELLSHFPYLTSIKMRGTDYQCTEVWNLLKAAMNVRLQDSRKLPLRELDSGCPFQFEFDNYERYSADEWRRYPGEMMRLVRDLRIPLQSIRLTPNLSQNEIQDILETNAGTLTNIFARMRATPPFAFPFGVHLPNLLFLSMYGGFCYSLDFLKYTPNLETLYIHDSTVFFFHDKLQGNGTTLISNASKAELADVQLLKLTKLSLDFAVSEDDLRWLVKWMPHVRKLRMFLDDKQFTLVCRNWKDLKKVEVLGNGLTDEGVTGMKPRMETRSGQGKMGEVIQPNITCLQKLEVFTAEVSTLTSASLRHGFLKMSNLRRVYFHNVDTMEDPAKEALLGKNVKITPYDWDSY